MRVLLVLAIMVALGLAGSERPAAADQAFAPADTLRFTLTAGESLVVPLPGPDDAEFRGVRLPSLSWQVGRSFAWRTLPGQSGREYILIQRRTPARTDTLVLVVDVE